jgi:hypothetical protein
VRQHWSLFQPAELPPLQPGSDGAQPCTHGPKPIPTLRAAQSHAAPACMHAGPIRPSMHHYSACGAAHSCLHVCPPFVTTPLCTRYLPAAPDLTVPSALLLSTLPARCFTLRLFSGEHGTWLVENRHGNKPGQKAILQEYSDGANQHQLSRFQDSQPSGLSSAAPFAAASAPAPPPPPARPHCCR